MPSALKILALAYDLGKRTLASRLSRRHLTERHGGRRLSRPLRHLERLARERRPGFDALPIGGSEERNVTAEKAGALLDQPARADLLPRTCCFDLRMGDNGG